MSKINEGPVDANVEREEGIDAFSVYLREVEARERMSREEEREVAEEIVACRNDVVTLLRNLLLEAGDNLGLDTAVVQRLREELADPSSAKKLETLQSRIDAVASLARRARETLGRKKRSGSAPTVTGARRLLAEITRGFGVSPATLERVAAQIAEKRQRIATAKQRLVEANLRLVLYFARKMKWRGVDLVDLVQEGNIALLRAADSYDPTRGFAFGSFACTAIRRAMARFGSATARPIYVPAEVRARRQRIRKAEHYLTSNDGTAPSWDRIAEYLDVPLADVVDALGEREEVLSLDAAIDDGVPIINRLADDTAIDAEEAITAAQAGRHARETVATLDERDRKVIESRFDLGAQGLATLAEVGNDLGVTRERARQLEARALRELRMRGSEGSEQRRKRRARPAPSAAVRAS